VSAEERVTTAVAHDAAPALVVGEPPKSTSRRGRPRDFGRWLVADKRALFGVLYLAVLLLASLLATFLAADPIEQDTVRLLEGPSAEHWLGTDDLGRDVFSRLLHGAQVSLRAATTAVVVAALVGVTLGVVSGFLGGWFDDVIMRFTDAVLAFPGLVLAVGVVAMLGPGLTNAMIAVGLVFAPILARLMRAQVLSVKGDPYVEAARTFGASGWQIVRRHVLPNALPPIIVQLALLFAVALLAEASLSFIGLGVQPPEPSWGSMLGRSYRFMRQSPEQVIVTGLVIMFTALAFNAIGDAFRDGLDPRRRRGRN
jgi:peptide/nickel transport system permease protein